MLSVFLSLFHHLLPITPHQSRGQLLPFLPLMLSFQLVLLFFRSCLGLAILLRFHGFPIIHRRHCLATDALLPWLSQPFHPSFCYLSWAFRSAIWSYVIDGSTRDWHLTVVLTLMNLCDLHLLGKKRILWWEVHALFICGCNAKCLEWSY